MNKNEPEYHISKCIGLIEERLGWGPSKNWSNYDFSKLSDEVQNRTQVRLSVTTLKRIWGKVKYDSAPTLTTLNTLSQFAGYSDWRSYCQLADQQEKSETKLYVEPIEPVSKPLKPRMNRWRLLLTLISIIGLIYFLTLSLRKPDAHKPVDFEFRADKIMTEGVPNSVVFHYDASKAMTDSVFIIQTWDIRRKKIVQKNNHDHSSIYYYPGFFRTKLIVDGTIVKTHDLWITSDGWLGLVEDDPMPIYFQKEEFLKDGVVEINEATLKAYNLSLHPKAPKLRFFNQRNLGNVTNANFSFETMLKTEFKEGSGACQHIEVLIQCKDDIIIIPLAAKACVGDLNLYFCGKNVTSKEADMSKFGCDLTQWTTLRVETVNKHVEIFVNDVMAYSLTFPHEPTDIVGVQYRFNGVGAIKNTWFEKIGGEVIYF
jgi:hypothetical protein